jgi:hypothetical protein
MAPHISNTNAGDEDIFFDMDPIFIGREHQLSFWATVSAQWGNSLVNVPHSIQMMGSAYQKYEVVPR